MFDMKTRQRRLALVPAFVVVVGLGLAFGVGVLGMAACAAPPPGWHRVPALGDFVGLVPALLVLLVGGYFAFGAERVGVRVLASVLVLIATVAVAFLALVFLPSCGRYAP